MKVVIIDTNVILRYLIGDITSQFKKAKEIFEEIEADKTKGLVSLLVLDELIWALEKYYELNKAVYLPEILKILALKNLKIIEVRKELVVRILKVMEKKKIDFTDVYLGQIAGKREILSFDRDFNGLASK